MITKASVTKGDWRAYLICAWAALLVSIYYWQDERYRKLKKDYDELADEYIDNVQQNLEFDICSNETIIWLCNELDKKENRDISDENVQKLKSVATKSMLNDYRYLRKTVR